MSGLIAIIERRPEAAFAAFLALHLVIWTALPALLYPNLPLDLIEALTYGREWQLGYDKLPPLPWWLVELVYRMVGHDVAYYALAQIAVVLAFAIVWLTAGELVGAVGALVAVLILDGLHYFHFTAAKFNHDVIQLPLWALAGYAFHAALRRGRMGHWVLLGCAIGIVLAAPLALFLLLDRQARPALATAGPYIALALALLIMAPHLVWLVRNDFLPFAYASARAAPSRGILDHVLHPLVFALGQLVFLLPALAIAAAVIWPQPKGEDAAMPGAAKADAFDRRIVTLLAFGPAATTVAISALSGRGAIAMWGYPLWLFLGLWIVLHARTAIEPARLGRIAAAWAGVFVLFAVVFAASYSVLPAIDHRYRAVFYPGDRLADELARRFRAATGRPLTYVIGSMWDGGNVAHYAPEQPRVLIDGDWRRAPWIDLGDVRSKGAVVVWTGSADPSGKEGGIDPTVMPVGLRAVAGDAQIQPPFTLPFRRGDRVLTVGWAILRPQPAFARH
ncbi:MAG: glycosyltransferase family 39 protein [Alphaproteobacteria bacterium]|nr:MAG: glycosyltransferase family 39 protein [Alphaproteobacteria bacterium]